MVVAVLGFSVPVFWLGFLFIYSFAVQLELLPVQGYVSFRQGLCPPRLLGRMNSVVRFMYWGTIPAGSLAAGLLAGPLGLRGTLLAAAVGSTLSCIPIMVSPIRRATVNADARAPGDGGLAAPAR